MRRARIAVVVFGVLLPFAARIPGVAWKGTDWLTSYFGTGLAAILLISAFNGICWGSILLCTFTYRNARAVWFPAVLGFGLPAIAHGCLDLSSDAQAAVALVFIPVFSLPLVLGGWLVGLWFDRRVFGDATRPT
jgi:hypothetical protein